MQENNSKIICNRRRNALSSRMKAKDVIIRDVLLRDEIKSLSEKTKLVIKSCGLYKILEGKSPNG